MSLAIVYSRARVGFNAPEVQVEVHLTPGQPCFSIVGLPETAVKESRDRVRSAIVNSNFEFPFSKRVTVNLAPADLPKEGGRFDLPIALGILAATRQIPTASLSEFEFAGELALSGELRPIQSTLILALACRTAQRRLVLPYQNAPEAALSKDLTILGIKHLSEICNYLHGRQTLQAFTLDTNLLPTSHQYSADLNEVKGQQLAKKALIIAAAGGHNLLMVGPPGTGKTMLASRIVTILPAMTEQEAIEAAVIQSLTGKPFNLKSWRNRPFRSPHHTASSVALVGGGSPPRPGEISLAHRGVLFLDELPEFNRHVLEALREPLESGTITISRAAQQAEFPACFQLIAAMNPCPCGYLGSTLQPCRCSPEQVTRYRNRLSGPLLDRIDLHVDVKSLSANVIAKQCLPSNQAQEGSNYWRERVTNCLVYQYQRQQKPNAQLGTHELRQFCSLDNEQESLLENAIIRLKLSSRASHRLLRVARTIADLNDSQHITTEHLLEALSFRTLTR